MRSPLAYQFHLGGLLLQPPLKQIKFMLPAQITCLANILTSQVWKNKRFIQFPYGQWPTNLKYLFPLSQLCKLIYRPNAKTWSFSLLHNRELCAAGYRWLMFGFKPWMGLGPANIDKGTDRQNHLPRKLRVNKSWVLSSSMANERFFLSSEKNSKIFCVQLVSYDRSLKASPNESSATHFQAYKEHPVQSPAS